MSTLRPFKSGFTAQRMKTRHVEEMKGTSFNILVFLLYLLKMHPNACTPIDLRDVASKIHKRGVMMYETDIMFTCKNKSYSFSLPPFFYEFLEVCMRNPTKEFILIPLTIRHEPSCVGGWTSPTAEEGEMHQNLLLIDKTKKLIERFEPHGIKWSTPYIKMDKYIDLTFQKILPGFLYNQDLFCPRTGFQRNESLCATWSLWYADLRLSNPEIDPQHLQKMAKRDIKENWEGLETFIKKYSTFAKTKLLTPKSIEKMLKDIPGFEELPKDIREMQYPSPVWVSQSKSKSKSKTPSMSPGPQYTFGTTSPLDEGVLFGGLPPPFEFKPPSASKSRSRSKSRSKPKKRKRSLSKSKSKSKSKTKSRTTKRKK